MTPRTTSRMSPKVPRHGSPVKNLQNKPKRDAKRERWDAAMEAALAPTATPATRLEAALIVIDSHIDGIVRSPAGWGDVLSAEIMVCELLLLRAVLLGVEPHRYGGEAFARAKIRHFKSDNGPASNWIGRDDYDRLTPLLKIAVRAEFKRMGVPSKVPTRRARKVGGAK